MVDRSCKYPSVGKILKQLLSSYSFIQLILLGHFLPRGHVGLYQGCFRRQKEGAPGKWGRTSQGGVHVPTTTFSSNACPTLASPVSISLPIPLASSTHRGGKTEVSLQFTKFALFPHLPDAFWMPKFLL